MGVDTNYLSARTFDAVLDGKTVTVGVYKWMCRYGDFREAQDYGYCNDPYYRMLKARIAKVENHWMANKMPDYAIWVGSSGKIANEAVVYLRDPDNAAEFHVDTMEIGQEVGMLKKVGKAWTIVPVYKCWDCKDTGSYVGTYMSSGDKVWVNGSICRCQVVGDPAARQRWAKEQAKKMAQVEENSAMLARQRQVKDAQASLDCSGL